MARIMHPPYPNIVTELKDDFENLFKVGDLHELRKTPEMPPPTPRIISRVIGVTGALIAYLIIKLKLLHSLVRDFRW